VMLCGVHSYVELAVFGTAFSEGSPSMCFPIKDYSPRSQPTSLVPLTRRRPPYGV
jgi:hypothetical protein